MEDDRILNLSFTKVEFCTEEGMILVKQDLEQQK